MSHWYVPLFQLNFSFRQIYQLFQTCQLKALFKKETRKNSLFQRRLQCALIYSVFTMISSTTQNGTIIEFYTTTCREQQLQKYLKRPFIHWIRLNQIWAAAHLNLWLWRRNEKLWVDNPNGSDRGRWKLVISRNDRHTWNNSPVVLRPCFNQILEFIVAEWRLCTIHWIFDFEWLQRKFQCFWIVLSKRGG